MTDAPQPRRTGHGDRWLAGETLEGVAFALHEPVRIGRGRLSGRRAVVVLLARLEPEPAYLIRLDDDGSLLRVPQSALERG